MYAAVAVVVVVVVVVSAVVAGGAAGKSGLKLRIQSFFRKFSKTSSFT
jgi:hypothetical protein